ncbi:putative vacuolar ATP synthase subunit C [Toxoplasma gondii TgCatPRC2]|uniref:V-type proton ATPase subunit C n=13 Tax=Toxoplasma gondii TaxID=5811 RepID=B6K9L7_TOXGV|nr:vacuolar ATP synthase subunit C, putative [Toxoplasma gondii ME49]ESS35331.1 putative vacuolar ATP synthase subunit C [Toxoplasma gondii VEG]KFG36797.1 putative vacuolar ATP synthase subunit C [Toxoplasma gondii GAB2-2007-GAL-DOM2]KFG49467.1 putative vacuolar ATP synthase subunit C [Toxoplasma gondii p89]KFG56365.1 putative vacuolar ATP synthase subunit C [Toxoplasma gondii FOU]KFG66363.1 putative vacuolar ATP synthase subunit C [Toxoplasma gondii RUB]KFH02071.1 putative vacuolar ATP synth|eukprot:XP_018635318.1 vacuolar ATP synthase subunit C, putative [Toxoplasma gondii ME49]
MLGSSEGGARGCPYWIVACNTDETHSAEQIFSSLKHAVLGSRNALCDEACLLDIPHLKFGTFDDLIRSVDILQKQDAYVESVIRRIERQAVEIDPDCELKVVWQRHSLTVDQYIRRFQWDDAKFPRLRAIPENLDALVQSVTKTDDEVRAKVAVWQEVRQQMANSASGKKTGPATYFQRDLIDVLSPDTVRDDDFLVTEHLTTAVVVVPRGQEREWEQSYESLDAFVVPRSSRKFNVAEDADGNALWRVILFTSHLQAFRQAAQAKKFVVRDFHYSPQAYKETVLARSRVEAEKTKQETFLSRVCFAAFSDIFVAWMHLKVMRTFCEAVLRFGVPPEYAAFVLRPVSEAKEKKLRHELDKLFSPKGGFGNSYFSGKDDPGSDDEDFYPYIWLALQPFGSHRASA